MDQKERERHSQRAVEAARKQLAEGTWPQVIAVAGYPNRNAPRTSDEEYERLKALFRAAGYSNVATFLSLVQLKEKERNVTMSFNLQRRFRPSLEAGHAPPTIEETANFLFCPDILVGTRSGTEGSATWLGKVSKVIPEMAPEVLEVLDKTLGEAVEVITKGTSTKMSISDLLRSALGGGEPPVSPPPTKH